MAKKTSVKNPSEKFLLVITAPERKYLSKVIDENCNKLLGFDAGYKVHFDIRNYTNFHVILQELFEAGGETAFLLSKPTEFLEAELEVWHTLQRRLKHNRPDQKDGAATVDDRDGEELSLDLDDIIMGLSGFRNDNLPYFQ